jgi:hypothetical protein
MCLRVVQAHKIARHQVTRSDFVHRHGARLRRPRAVSPGRAISVLPSRHRPGRWGRGVTDEMCLRPGRGVSGVGLGVGIGTDSSPIPTLVDQWMGELPA